MRYRGEIDGIRALAILPVILFHAGVPGFAGGFVGVDIFFVISGYLITGLIRAEFETGQFSIAGFYDRRARRILPALFLVCIVCVPVAWSLYLPSELAGFGASLVAVVGFVSNFYFLTQGDYFSAPSETLPLFHTWSLAVEEQFYLLYPLLLLALRSRSLRFQQGAVLGISAASLVTCVALGVEHPSANFFLLPSRAWELGLGALAAMATFRLADRWHDVVALSGLAAITASLIIFDADSRHPGLITLVPVLGTVALLCAATPRTWVGRFLSSRLLVGIGLVSYSAYLWHQPILSFARSRFGELDAVTIALAIAGTFGLAWLSWRFFEQPFRQKARIPTARVVLLGATAGVALIVAGCVAMQANKGRERIGDAAQVTESWLADQSPTYKKCLSHKRHLLDISQSCIHGQDDGGHKVAIVGDSLAASIAHRLGEALAGTGWPLIEITRAACPPAAGLDIAHRVGAGCAEFNRTAALRLSQPDIEVVVMFARWSQYVDSEPFDNGEGGSTRYASPAKPVGLSFAADEDELRKQEVGRRYARSVSALLAAGKRVALVYPIPEVGWSVPKEMANRRRAGTGGVEAVSTDPLVFQARHAITIAALDSVPDSPNLIRIRPDALFCNTALPGRCVAEIDGRPLYYDDSHLNDSYGARLVAGQIRSALDSAGWLLPR